MISKTAVTYGYSDTLHAHAATHLNGVQKDWYDANGNMTRRVEGSVTYAQTWDIENRLTVVTATNGLAITVTRFTYDGDPLRLAARAGGKRVKKTEGVTSTVYVGAMYEKNVTTGVTTTYYYAGSQRVAMRQGGVLYYLQGDHLGSTSLVTSITGTVVARQLYGPYGAPRPGGTGTLPTDYRFTGQRADSYIKLIEMGARWYDACVPRSASKVRTMTAACDLPHTRRVSLNLSGRVSRTFARDQRLLLSRSPHARMVARGEPCL